MKQCILTKIYFIIQNKRVLLQANFNSLRMNRILLYHKLFS